MAKANWKLKRSGKRQLYACAVLSEPVRVNKLTMFLVRVFMERWPIIAITKENVTMDDLKKRTYKDYYNCELVMLEGKYCPRRKILIHSQRFSK